MWRLFLFLTAISAQKLPSYIHSCSQSEPDFNKCFLKSAKEALPSIVHGDKAFRIPSLTPLKIEKILVNPTPTFKMGLTNISIYGFENTVIKGADIQLDKNQFSINFHIPVLELKAEYTTSGRVLILPIEGTGPATIKALGGDYKYSVEMEHYDRKGQDHIKIKKSLVDYDLDRVEYNLENLFNGNQQLSDHMNKFMNENWIDVHAEFKPTIKAIVKEIGENIMSNVIKNTPYNEIFRP